MKKKGVIFTMDAIMAIAVVFLIIVMAHSQLAGVDLGYWNNMYAQKIAADVVAVLDEEGILATLDADAIESNITELLPENYQMWAQIDSYARNLTLDRTLTVGQEPANEDIVVSGRRVFVSGSDYIENYNVIRYQIWPR